MKNIVAVFLLAALGLTSGQSAPKPVEAAPVVIDNSSEVAELNFTLSQVQAKLDVALAEVQQLKSEAGKPVVQAPPTATETAQQVPTAYYERRAVYGRFGRFRGYQTVLVSGQPYQTGLNKAAYTSGNCASGNCGVGPVRRLLGR